ncbi:MAG: hypothetical protein RL328_965 [Acidobacteriota bacterium]
MTTPLPVPAKAASQDVKRQRAIDALSKLPPFSPILSKLMASLAGQDVSFVVLGDLIEKDTVVAGNILRVVNSAIYARRGEVSSVRRALSVLGLEKVRNTVLAMSVSRMLNQVKAPPGWSMGNFNRHAAGVAMLADLLSQHVAVDYPEGAFVAGLLHDVGQMLIAMGLREDYIEIQRLNQSGLAWTECEHRVLGFDHASLSTDALLSWKLPQPISTAVGQHHDPPPAVPGQPLPLGRVLQAADTYANAFGLTIRADHPEDDGREGLLALGLAPAALDRILEQFHAEHNAIAQFYQ